MPKARAKTKGVLTPPVDRRRIDSASRSDNYAERPSSLAASSGPSNDDGEVSRVDLRMVDPQPLASIIDTNLKEGGPTSPDIESEQQQPHGTNLQPREEVAQDSEDFESFIRRSISGIIDILSQLQRESGSTSPDIKSDQQQQPHGTNLQPREDVTQDSEDIASFKSSILLIQRSISIIHSVVKQQHEISIDRQSKLERESGPTSPDFESDEQQPHATNVHPCEDSEDVESFKIRFSGIQRLFSLIHEIIDSLSKLEREGGTSSPDIESGKQQQRPHVQRCEEIAQDSEDFESFIRRSISGIIDRLSKLKRESGSTSPDIESDQQQQPHGTNVQPREEVAQDSEDFESFMRRSISGIERSISSIQDGMNSLVKQQQEITDRLSKLERARHPYEDGNKSSSSGISSDVKEVPTEDPRKNDPKPGTSSDTDSSDTDYSDADDINSSSDDFYFFSSGLSSDDEKVPTEDPGKKEPKPWTSLDTDPSGESVQMARSSPLSAAEVIEACKKEIKDNVAWLKKAKPHQKNLLKNYLLNLDASERVDFDNEKSIDICKGVDKIMNMIREKITVRDPRFKGDLVTMGSAHNATKIGKLNEFDYVYELEVHLLLERKGIFKRYDCQPHDKDNAMNIILKFASKDDFDQCKPFALKDISHENTNQNNIMLNITYIRKLFGDILNNVLQELELPSGWRHGGFNRPNFSGIHHNGKAYLIQFDYMETDETSPLRLSVDFVPMIRIPNDDVVTMEKEKAINIITGTKHCWVSLKSGLVSHSYAQKLWLTQYSSKSMPKAVMRIGKDFSCLLKMNSKRLISLERLTDVQQGNVQTKIHFLRKDKEQFVFDTDEYVTYFDEGESVPDVSFVKSYAIKQAVMEMMMSDESHGHKWTEKDLPDLVICVYMLLVECHLCDIKDRDQRCSTKSESELMRDLQFVKNKFSISLKDTSQINDQTCSVQLETVEPPVNFSLTDTFRRNSNDYIINFSLRAPLIPLQLSRLSAVFQLLKSVCEGHNTAEIVTHKQVIPRGHFSLRDLVTKE